MSLATSSFLRTIIKAVESHLGQRLPRFRRGTVVGQSGNPLKVLVSPSGEQGVADGFEYPVLRSYTSVTVDDPGGPHEGDDLLILETTPNNPVLLGQLLTGPNDKANRDSYPGIDKVSITQNAAKKLRAHAITISHVPPIDADVPANARDGMPVVSTYDNSLWVRSSGVWERISLPVGGTTAQALAKVSGTDYDVSWQDVAAGPGWVAGVAMLATDEFHTVVSGDILGGFASGLMTWKTPPSGNLDFDTGSYFDAAHPRRLTIQTDGIYEISGQIEFRTDSGAGSFKGIVELWKTGAAMALPDLIVDAMGMSNPVANGDMTVNISIPLQCVATDYFELAWFTTPGVAGQKINGSSSWFSIKRIG